MLGTGRLGTGKTGSDRQRRLQGEVDDLSGNTITKIVRGAARKALPGHKFPRVRKFPRVSQTTVLAESKGPCPKCRGLDTPSEVQRIASAVAGVLAERGISAWRLPSAAGIRVGVDAAAAGEALQAIRDALPGEGAAVALKVIDVRNNKYEFDQVTTVPPEKAEYLRLYPTPHCKLGKQYLRRRWVSVEPLSLNDEFALVPRAGFGPRVYAFDRLAKLKLQNDGFVPSQRWPFPLDLVYTWVDSSDPRWRDQFARYAGEGSERPLSATNAARWQMRDELRYSLRSAWMYAPFVRNIYIVTSGQVPSWLVDGGKARVVAHSELFDDPEMLPTFSSRPIESVLHRIEGLSEHFVYLNDDFFFGAPVGEEDLFTVGGIGKVFFSNRYLDARPVSPYDRASVVSHKNSRDALAERFGSAAERKFKHAPYVMRRSVWESIEKEFKEELDRTRRNRFRSWNDVNPVPFLYNHYALLTGYAAPADIGYQYVDIGAPDLEERLAELESDDGVKVFCVNDADSDHDTPESNERIFADFLTKRYPVIPPWERD